MYPVSPLVNANPPLGLAYLGAVAEAKGCEVKIIDAAAPYANYTIEDMVKIAKEFSPHLVGVSITTILVKYSYLLLDALAKAKIESLVVIGGPHATLFPHEVLEYHPASIVVRGEGVETFSELIDYLRRERKIKNILGISYKDGDGHIKDNPTRVSITDLDALPLPAKHCFIRSDYVRTAKEKERYGNIISSIGCPGRCTYCSRKALVGQGYRFRSVENILDEMIFLMKEYGINHFKFIDDVFTVNKVRVKKLCNQIIEKELDISWVCITRVDFVDKELLEKIKSAGCRCIGYGIESGNPKTLERIKKGFNREKAKEVIKMTRDTGLNCSVNFMFGFPWEDEKDIRVSTEYIKDMMHIATAIYPGSILIPLPGTEIYEEYKDEYNLEKWWLKDWDANLNTKSKRMEYPLFAKIFFDSVVYGRGFFFKYSKEVVKEIMRAVDFIGKQNMKEGSKQITTLPILNRLVFHAIVTVCKLSRMLYKISPTLERILMKPFSNAIRKYQR